ncbi:MAG: C40 family peptidase [Eggerthellaceae bacterium]|nr:C40 family peptidase [Eggerthellaceae bacterium]
MTEHKHEISRRKFLTGASLTVGLAASVLVTRPKDAKASPELDRARNTLITLQAEQNHATVEFENAYSEQLEAEQKVQEAQDQINQANKTIQACQKGISDNFVNSYKNRTSVFDVVLGTGVSSLGQFLNNLSLYKKSTDNLKDMADNCAMARKTIEESKVQMEENAQIAREKATLARNIAEDCTAKVSAAQAVFNSLDASEQERIRQEQAAYARANSGDEGGFGGASGGGSVGGGDRGGDRGGNRGGNRGGDRGGDRGSSGAGAHSEVAGIAAQYLGVPYVWGGSSPAGFDCSGLTSYCYKQIGIWIGRTTSDQRCSARGVTSVGGAGVGDVLWNSGHVGICTRSGGGQYIHAPRPGEFVSYSSWPQFNLALSW